jgi:hypothetical protein
MNDHILGDRYIYRPRSAGVGKSLQHFDEELIDFVTNAAADMMQILGYHISKQSSEGPSVRLGIRPMKSQPQSTGVPAFMLVNGKVSVRETSDEYGRGMTMLRKALTDGDTQPFSVKPR